MVTVIESNDVWGDVGRNFGKGTVKGYQNQSDDRALQKTIQNLPPDASPKDVLNAILGTNTYSNEAKQQALKNYMGVKEFEETQRKAKEQAALQRARNDILQAKESRIAQAKDDARSNVKTIVNQLDLPEEQKESLGESLDIKGATDLLKQQITQNEKKLNPLKNKGADEYIELTKELGTLKTTLEDIDYAESLSDDLGYTGTLWSTLGLSRKGKELEGVAFPLIQPILKMLAPSGAIAAQKLKTTQEKYAIRGSDAPWNRKAKLDALRRFAKQAEKRATDRMEFLKKHDFSPPKEELERFDRDSETIVDAMLDYDIQAEDADVPAEASKFKGQTITSPDGQKYYSDGQRWVKK